MRRSPRELVGSRREERGRWVTPKGVRETAGLAYERSGLTPRGFARREGIKYSTFGS